MDFGTLFRRFLFLLLAPLYGGLFLFMNLTFKWWEGLAG